MAGAWVVTSWPGAKLLKLGLGFLRGQSGSIRERNHEEECVYVHKLDPKLIEWISRDSEHPPTFVDGGCSIALIVVSGGRKKVDQLFADPTSQATAAVEISKIRGSHVAFPLVGQRV